MFLVEDVLHILSFNDLLQERTGATLAPRSIAQLHLCEHPPSDHIKQSRQRRRTHQVILQKLFRMLRIDLFCTLFEFFPHSAVLL